MALNVWGMPAVIGSMDKELRMKVSFNIILLTFVTTVQTIMTTSVVLNSKLPRQLVTS